MVPRWLSYDPHVWGKHPRSPTVGCYPRKHWNTLLKLCLLWANGFDSLLSVPTLAHTCKQSLMWCNRMSSGSVIWEMERYGGITAGILCPPRLRASWVKSEGKMKTLDSKCSGCSGPRRSGVELTPLNCRVPQICLTLQVKIFYFVLHTVCDRFFKEKVWNPKNIQEFFVVFLTEREWIYKLMVDMD